MKNFDKQQWSLAKLNSHAYLSWRLFFPCLKLYLEIRLKVMSLFCDWLLKFCLLFSGNQSSAPSNNNDASDDVDGGEDLMLLSFTLPISFHYNLFNNYYIAYTHYPIHLCTAYLICQLWPFLMLEVSWSQYHSVIVVHV